MLRARNGWARAQLPRWRSPSLSLRLVFIHTWSKRRDKNNGLKRKSTLGGGGATGSGREMQGRGRRHPHRASGNSIRTCEDEARNKKTKIIEQYVRHADQIRSAVGRGSAAARPFHFEASHGAAYPFLDAVGVLFSKIFERLLSINNLNQKLILSLM